MINLMTIWVKEMPINVQDPIIVLCLAQTDVGLKNLFKLVSISHMNIFIVFHEFHVRNFKNTVKELLLVLAVIKGKYLKE